MYLKRSNELVGQGKLSEATGVCFAANTLLGPYDNDWVLDYRCDMINLQVVIPVGLALVENNREDRNYAI